MEKWANVDAGPRQLKDLEKVMGKLSWEGKTHDELSGVTGGDEHTSSFMSMFSPPRAEVIALDEAIREKYDYKITRKNLRQIIADYEAALPEARESRPTVDSRRSADEDAELKAKIAAREAEEKVQRDARNAVLNQVMAKKPAGAKALIVAELKADNSDPMTDYFSNTTARTVAIGWRFSAREDFKALHTAAANFPKTAHMASDETFRAWHEANGYGSHGEFDVLEHRDNYSMGHGNYLSDHGWDGAGSGWVVKSRNLPCTYLSLTEDALPERTETPSTPAGDGSVTVSPSSLGRDDVVEIRFADKPDAEVISGLKARGFRWARGNRCWYGRDTEYANSLV